MPWPPVSGMEAQRVRFFAVSRSVPVPWERLDVLTPTLTGMGERSHLLTRDVIGMAAGAATAISAFWKRPLPRMLSGPWFKWAIENEIEKEAGTGGNAWCRSVRPLFSRYS